MHLQPKAVLKINDLTVAVHLGCTPEERLKKQEIRVSFQIRLAELPVACLTDKLGETVCYETLIQSIHRSIDSHFELNTIEKLAYDCFQDLKKQIPAEAKLFLSIQKVNPPIDILKGGVHFELADEGFFL